MGRDEERIRNDIERSVGKLRCDIEALDTSQAIDGGVIRELMQIIEEIEGHTRATLDPRIRAVPD